MVPHLEHAKLIVVVVAAGIYMWVLIKGNTEKHYNTHQCCFVWDTISLHALGLMNLRLLQASTPSIQLCSAFSISAPPHFLYQSPPGAQQLTRPDFSNVPHFEHVMVLANVGVMNSGLTEILVMSSRSGIGRRDTC